MVRKLICALLLCGSLGLALAWMSLRPLWHLPEPAVADQRQLLYWIALRDLQKYPAEIHVTLVDRFQADVDPRDLLQQSQSSSRALKRYGAQIEQNAKLLKRVWFETRCQQYAACANEQRYEFLDQQLKAVFNWSAVFAVDSKSSIDGEAPETRTASQMLQEIEAWISSAKPADKPTMRRAVHDAAVCWLASTDLRPFPPPIRRYIAQRIALEIGRSDSAIADRLPLQTEQQQRLQQNAMILVEAWINWQAEQYAELALERRPEMIDTCLDEVQSWKLDHLLTGGESRDASNIWLQVSTLLPQWLQAVEPQQREQLQAFITHLQQRFIWRALQNR